MYGFNERAERQKLENAVTSFKSHVDSAVSGSEPFYKKFATYIRKLEVKDGAEDAVKFIKLLETLRSDLLYDGGCWVQHPFDLLAHTENNDVKNEDLYDLFQGWELLTMAFKFLRNVSAAGTTKTKELKVLRRKVETYGALILRQRQSLDVFDRQISYPERAARHRGKTLYGTAEDAKIVIPYKAYSTFRNQTRTRYWIDLTVFCAMVYRHLKNLGVTEQDLAKRDYWILPGGMYGFGLCQSRYSSETFFHHVSKFLEKAEGPLPVRLKAYNGEWMVSISPEVFGWYAAADILAKPQQTAVEAILAEEIAQQPTGQNDDVLLAAFLGSLKEVDGGVAADEDGNLFFEDDGSRRTGDLIYKVFNLYQYIPPEEEQSNLRFAQLFQIKTGSSTLWKEILEENLHQNWGMQIQKYVRKLDADLQTNRHRASTISLMKNAKGWEDTAPRLLIGYYVWTREEKNWEVEPDEIAQILFRKME